MVNPILASAHFSELFLDGREGQSLWEKTESLTGFCFTAKAERKAKSGLGKYLFSSCTYLIKWKEPINYEITKYWVEGSVEKI